jgi:drug/metabolite transporter (DMT)-like permease
VFSGVWLGVGGGHVGHVPWGLVIYLGLGCTAATTFLQAVAQRVVPSPQAAVIFSLDPVFAAIFGFIFLGEGMGARELSGAVLIIGAAFLCQVPQGERSTLARESSTG